MFAKLPLVTNQSARQECRGKVVGSSMEENGRGKVKDQKDGKWYTGVESDRLKHETRPGEKHLLILDL